MGKSPRCVWHSLLDCRFACISVRRCSLDPRIELCLGVPTQVTTCLESQETCGNTVLTAELAHMATSTADASLDDKAPAGLEDLDNVRQHETDQLLEALRLS